MKNFICLLTIFFVPWAGHSQWVQLGQPFESLNYNQQAPASYNGNQGGVIPSSYLGDEYGDAVALSADGSIMAVGAPSQYNPSYGYDLPGFGYVQVFRYTDEGWIQIGEELRTGDRDNPWPHNLSHFGFKVALSDDGNILAVTEPHWRSVEEDLLVRGGRVHVYENINDQWIQIGEPITEYDEMFFGESLSLSADGSIVAVGNHKFFDGENGGQVKTYKNISGEWIQFGSTLTEPYDGLNMFEEPLFGQEITMSADGKTLVVGMGAGGIGHTSPAEARIFEYIADDWVLTQTIYGSQGTNFTYSMSLSADGSRLAISTILQGKVALYDKIGSTWEQTASIFWGASSGLFGTSISLSADGNVLAAGSVHPMNLPTSQHLRVYHWDGANWVQNGSFYYEPTWIDGSGQIGGMDTVVALSADGSVLAVGDRTYSIPDVNSNNGVYTGAGRAYAYLDCSFVDISVKAEDVGIICEGQQVTLTANIEQEVYVLRGIVNWYANVNDTVPFHTGISYETPILTETTSYWVEAVTPTGCLSERVEVMVVVNPITSPFIMFSYPEICMLETSVYPILEEDFTLGGIFTAPSEIVFVDNTTGEIDLEASTAGTYTITYTFEANGCFLEGAYSNTITIYEVTAPIVEFSYGGICRFDTFVTPSLASGFVSGGAFSSNSPAVSVDPLTGEIDVTNSELGTYTITYEVEGDEDLCTENGSFSIEIAISPCFIPKGISPNRDGKNDVFDLAGIGVKELKIYNRYGKEVYSQHNYVSEWEGQDKNNNELPNGTYFYTIIKNDGENLTGWVYVNRAY